LIASMIVKAHEPMTIKPTTQINAIAISLILTSCVWSEDRIGIGRVDRYFGSLALLFLMKRVGQEIKIVERGGWPLSMAETAAALQSRPRDGYPCRETGRRSLPTNGCDQKEEKEIALVCRLFAHRTIGYPAGIEPACERPAFVTPPAG
jgi:hypothetical protein